MATNEVGENVNSALALYVHNTVFNTEARTKILRLATIKRNLLYVEGKQYLLQTPALGGRGVVDYVPLSITDVQTLSDDVTSIIAPVYNQIRSLGRKFQAVLAQRSPNCQAEPLVESDQLQSAAARAATKIVQALRKQWDSEGLQKQIAFAIFCMGTPIAQVTWCEDGQKYGEREEVIEVEGMDPETGIPYVDRIINTFANGAPEVAIYSEENITIPPLAKKWPSDVTFLIKAEDWRQGKIIRRWPQAAGLLSQEPTSNSYTSTSQVFRASLRGTSRSNNEEVLELFLHPDEYPILARHGMSVEELDQLYPRGLRAWLVKGQVMEVQPAVLEEEWGLAVPDFTDFLLADPLMDDAVQGQDSLNTQMAIMHETMESTMPVTLLNSEAIDAQAWKEARSGIGGRILPVSVENGSLSDQTHNLPQASPDPRIVEWTQWAMEMSKELIGILPAIYGGDVGVTQTAYEAERRLNQALMQLTICWQAVRSLWSQIYVNALRMVSQRPTSALEDYGVTESDLALLRECFKSGSLKKVRISVEESIPATRAQVGALVREILQMGPQAMSLLGADAPDNAGRIRDALGLVGWSSSLASLQEWVRKKIQILSQEAPMPAGVDPMTGQPVPGQPTEPVDPTFGDPQMIGLLGQQWLITEGEKLLEQDPNHPGYQNVLLWVQGYQQLAQQLAQPPENEAP